MNASHFRTAGLTAIAALASTSIQMDLPKAQLGRREILAKSPVALTAGGILPSAGDKHTFRDGRKIKSVKFNPDKPSRRNARQQFERALQDDLV
jgi:hypothetical protein